MRRSILLSVLLLGLVACDSTDPAPAPLDPSLFIGEWEVSLSESTSYATLAVTQDVPDFTQPATSGLSVNGDRTTSLVYVTEYFNPGERSGLLRATDFQYGSAPSTWASLEVIRDPSSYDSFELTTESGLNLYLHTLEGDARNAVSFDRLGVTIDAVTVPFRDGGSGEIVVDGRLDFATRRVAAGEEIAKFVGAFSGSVPDAVVFGFADRVVFGSSGSVRLEIGSPDDPLVLIGTWEVEGQQLRVTINTESALFDVDASNGLRLVSSDEQTVTSGTAASFLLEPGTVDSWRRESVVELTRESARPRLVGSAPVP